MIIDDHETGSFVSYHPGFLSVKEGDDLLDTMLSLAPWEQEAPVIFGVKRLVKRKTCAFGDPGVSYRYSGMTKHTQPWPDLLVPILERIQKVTGVVSNLALANLYPDGQAGLGRHADDEPDIVPFSPIAGLSLGSSRDFILYRGTKEAARVLLDHGSLVVMSGKTQAHYTHAIPTRAKVITPRVSLTFRVMRSDGRN